MSLNDDGDGFWEEIEDFAVAWIVKKKVVRQMRKVEASIERVLDLLVMVWEMIEVALFSVGIYIKGGVKWSERKLVDGIVIVT